MRHDRGASSLAGARRTRPLKPVPALALAGLCALGCAPQAAPPVPDPPGEPPRSSAEAPEFERLRGRWERTDGGYVLEVRAVSPEGRVEAAYLNPRPIQVAQAEASRTGGLLSLFVELQDVNYPGSSYHLGYDAARDVLEGTYFQAVEKQTFAVSFARR